MRIQLFVVPALPLLIFGSRWLQLPLYLGLVVLGLVDVVMISNLLIMVIVGGYETFVSRLELEGHPDQPEWLSHVNASVLKIKRAMAIIGISSIHLLRTCIEAGDLDGIHFRWWATRRLRRRWLGADDFYRNRHHVADDHSLRVRAVGDWGRGRGADYYAETKKH